MIVYQLYELKVLLSLFHFSSMETYQTPKSSTYQTFLKYPQSVGG